MTEEKYALIGGRLSHSYSRQIHNKYFEIENKNAVYNLVEVEDDCLENIVLYFAKSNFKGINVTIPHKKSIMKCCTSISSEAEKIGAINTLKFINGKVVGYNTDYFGLKLTAEKNKIEIKNKDVLILGTGGASKAVIAVCKDMGCKNIRLVSRNPFKENDIETISYNDNLDSDVLFNCTPVGMYPDINASPIENPIGYNAVIDLIYNPVETLLMKNAKNNGSKTVNGLYMLVSQAIFSQAIWNDTEPDVCVIDKIYSEMRNNL